MRTDMLKEFKAFAMRGNVLDLAIGVIIGAAFGKIVTSFVSDVLMPPLSLLIGKTDMTNKFIDLSGTPHATLAEAKAAGAATLNYGLFVNSVIDFLIVAFVIFLVVKQINKLMPPPPVVAGPAMKNCQRCTSSIPVAATRCPHCTSDV